MRKNLRGSYTVTVVELVHTSNTPVKIVVITALICCIIFGGIWIKTVSVLGNLNPEKETIASHQTTVSDIAEVDFEKNDIEEIITDVPEFIPDSVIIAEEKATIQPITNEIIEDEITMDYEVIDSTEVQEVEVPEEIASIKQDKEESEPDEEEFEEVEHEELASELPQIDSEPEEPVQSDVGYKYVMTSEEREILERVVEAEVGNYSNLSDDELITCKIAVAQVFYNRTQNDRFKVSTLKDALTAPGASSTFDNGSYYSVTVSDLTRQACEMAFRNDCPDYSRGGLFFHSGKSTTSPYGSYIYTDSVGHHFFK